MRIESHQHYWKVERGDYHWMSPTDQILNRDYLPADLNASLVKHKIAKTILVQAAQTVAETDFLLQLAANEPSIAGVVGWLDMDDPEFIERFKSYKKNPKFLGLRPMLHDLSDDRWILRSQVLENLRYLADADFPFEFLTFPRHLPFALQAIELVPHLRAVIDHISKPEICAGKLEPWKGLIADVARHPNVFCKLSGLITEADHRNWTVGDLQPYVEHVVYCFGSDRLMFGSDWPVCLLAGSYDQVFGALESTLSLRLDEGAERKVFGENAIRFYKLTV